jgi:hypothetical protein
MLHRVDTTVDTVLSAKFHKTMQAREIHVSIRTAPTEEYAVDMNNA